jgi:hypothetical protein
MLPDQSEPKICTDDACTDFVLFQSVAYFLERKLAFIFRSEESFNQINFSFKWKYLTKYFEYRSPIQLRNNFINPIQFEMNIFVPKSKWIWSDLHNSSGCSGGLFMRNDILSLWVF